MSSTTSLALVSIVLSGACDVGAGDDGGGDWQHGKGDDARCILPATLEIDEQDLEWADLRSYFGTGIVNVVVRFDRHALTVWIPGNARLGEHAITPSTDQAEGKGVLVEVTDPERPVNGLPRRLYMAASGTARIEALDVYSFDTAAWRMTVHLRGVRFEGVSPHTGCTSDLEELTLSVGE
jgi:hypothetical protein